MDIRADEISKIIREQIGGAVVRREADQRQHLRAGLGFDRERMPGAARLELAPAGQQRAQQGPGRQRGGRGCANPRAR